MLDSKQQIQRELAIVEDLKGHVTSEVVAAIATRIQSWQERTMAAQTAPSPEVATLPNSATLLVKRPGTTPRPINAELFTLMN